jgi:hypothetical protein
MPKTIVFLTAVLLLSITCSYSYAAELFGPNVTVRNNNIFVSASLSLEEKQIAEIEQGVSKEIIFYFDLFRGWTIWPDEFVLGRTFTQTLHCDPVRKEYIATSLTSEKLTEKRFRNCKELIDWSLEIPTFRLTNTSELEPAEYIVRTTAESRLRRLPPFINLLFFFVKETEYRISEDSPYFPLKFDQ